ncbi:MAG: SRPBCC domain-containing protein [Myxococcales bacterium]|nr:SRPBCC domain-containing protein [Myxococcales bacterium]
MMNTETTIDRDTFTITFRRRFVAAPEDVFDAWTDPMRITCWWDPSGTPLADCTVDLRPGGAFRFTLASDHAPPFEGVYREAVRPARLVFDAMGAIGTVLLAAEGAKTDMLVTIRCGSAEHLEQFVRLGVADGTDRTLDLLVEHVEGQRRR